MSISAISKLPWTSLVGMNGRTILCVTTLSHRRFVDDVVQVVGLPIGARLLLRYRKRYVAPELWTAAKEQHSIEWHALVVLGAHVNGVDCYEPLRVGRVSRLVISGEILTLDIALGGYAADGSYVWPQIAQMAKNLPATLSGHGARLGHYAQGLATCPSNVIVDESVEGWERAADAFFPLDTELCTPFLFMMEGDSSVFRRYRESGELVIESGAKLIWSIHTKCAPQIKGIKNPLGEVLFDIACPPMRMITSRRVRVDSRRDVKQMQLASEAVFRTVPGHLSVKVITFHDKANDGVQPASERELITLSRHDIPVQAGRVLPTVASLAAAVAASAALMDGSGFQDWVNHAIAGCAGILVFLSLRYGFRGGSS
jgi:hypothetical protein